MTDEQRQNIELQAKRLREAHALDNETWIALENARIAQSIAKAQLDDASRAYRNACLELTRG